MTRRADRPVSTDLDSLFASWMRSLRARNMYVATQKTYRAAANQLTRFLAKGDITTAAQVDRAAV